MPSTAPNPQTWILRFKQNRTTILLHLDPLQSLALVKQQLLTAIQETHPDGTLNGIPIPDLPSEIQLGRPRNINDLTAGFELIESNDTSTNGALDGDVSGKGKGKASAVPAVRPKKDARDPKTQLKDCPQGAGLRDHGIVAFKFKPKDGDVVTSIEEDEDEGIQVAKEDMVGVEEQWDVVVPSFEETYGEEP